MAISREALARIERIEEVLQARMPPQSVNWKPRDGPGPKGMQVQVIQSKADIIFAGGSVGTGKTQLLLGMAGTLGRKSIIFRRTFQQMLDIEQIAQELYGYRNYHAQRRLFKLRGRTIELGAVANAGSESAYDGRPHDYFLFDEIPHFLERQYRHLIAWMRTDIPGHRCRVVCTGNPPDAENPEQAWVVRYWGPWLDGRHANPAEPGELRWYTSIAGKDQEVDGPEPIMVGGDLVRPMSRTYIPGEMVPEYQATGYAAVLQALQEPLRSRLLKGDFSVGRGDHPLQVIPSEWVDQAMQRWAYTAKPDMRMSAVGIDPSRGGRDAHVISPRYGPWYSELISIPGKEVPDGGTSAALCIQYRRDGCPAHVDVIGIGSSTVDYLRDADVSVVALNGARSSDATDRTGKIKFANKRAQWHWEMREALDPDHGHSICLPPEPELRGDLCASRWKLRGGRLAVEEKDEVKLRIGRSPDKGDACIYALAESSVVAISPSAFATGSISCGNTQSSSYLS